MYLVLFRKRPQKNRDDRRPPGDFYLTGTSLRLPKRIGKAGVPYEEKLVVMAVIQWKAAMRL